MHKTTLFSLFMLAAAAAHSQPIAEVSTGGGTCAPGYPCHMLYYGGKVIPNAKIYLVNWTSAVAPNGDLAGFYQTVTNSNYLDWLAEYNTTITTTGVAAPPAISSPKPVGSPGTNQLIGRGVYARDFTITPSAANAGGTATCASGGPTTNCCPSGHIIAGFTCITDTQIKNELNAQIAAGNLPAPDENALYMTHFPPKTFITDSAGNFSCVGGGFCGYHGTVRNASREFYYAVLPDHGEDSGGCDVGCGSSINTWQALTSTTSHEVIEAITDAEVGLQLDSALSWYDPGDGDNHQNGENADVCVNYHATVGGYTVQSAFSNVAGQCLPSRVAASDFSVSLPTTRMILAPGESKTVPVTTAITGTDGTPVTLTLTVAGAPANVTTSLGFSSLSSGGSTMLTVTAGASAAAAPGGVIIQVVATAGSNVHTAGLFLVVVPSGASTASDFGFSLSNAAPSVLPDSRTTLRVISAVAAGLAETITLSASGLPSGVTPEFDPPTIVSGGSSNLTLTAQPSTALGNAVPFTVTGVSASATHSASGALTVKAPPGPPTAVITHPADNTTVSGVVEIDATATPGGDTTIAAIELLVDGVVYGTVTSSTAVFQWDSTTVANGSHAVVVQATDNKLAQGLSPLMHLNVNNAPPAPPPSKKGSACASGDAGIAALLGLLALGARRRRQ